jgi:adenosine/AMP kinase
MVKNEFTMELVELKNIPEHNVIVGMSHFIKTVEDVHELMVNCVPGAKFGLAFCEASGPRLIRTSGTEKVLVDEATRMAKLLSAGHVFVLVMKDMFPINILPRLKQVPEIVNIFCATANPLQVVIAETDQGRGLMGVIDGGASVGEEKTEEVRDRKDFLRKIGYKI